MNEHIRHLREAEASQRMHAREAMLRAADALYPEARGGVHDASAETAEANRLTVRMATLQNVRNALVAREAEQAQRALDARMLAASDGLEVGR